MQEIFNKRGAAKVIGVSVDSINRLKRDGKLPYHQVLNRVIFTEQDLTAFLDSCAIPATVAPSPRERLEATKRAAGGAA